MRAIVRSRYGGPEVLALAEVDAPVPADDEAVNLAWDPGFVHVFDRASGERLDP